MNDGMLGDDEEDGPEVLYDEAFVQNVIRLAAERGFREGWTACNTHREAQMIAIGCPESARFIREAGEVEGAQFEASEAAARGLSQ